MLHLQRRRTCQNQTGVANRILMKACRILPSRPFLRCAKVQAK
jgi:hypothetical protein